MAGITEIYAANAMMNSQMTHYGRDMTGVEVHNMETEYKLKKVTEKILEDIHTSLNEPSTGLFRIQEHVRRSLPQLVDRKIEMQSINQQVQGVSFDTEYSLKTVQSMAAIPHFTIIQECLKSAIASKQNLDRVIQERKNPVTVKQVDEEPEIIEQGSVEAEGFICPNCLVTWSNDEELLQHWHEVHDLKVPEVTVGENVDPTSNEGSLTS